MADEIEANVVVVAEVARIEHDLALDLATGLLARQGNGGEHLIVETDAQVGQLRQQAETGPSIVTLWQTNLLLKQELLTRRVHPRKCLNHLTLP